MSVPTPKRRYFPLNPNFENEVEDEDKDEVKKLPIVGRNSEDSRDPDSLPSVQEDVVSVVQRTPSQQSVQPLFSQPADHRTVTPLVIRIPRDFVRKPPEEVPRNKEWVKTAGRRHDSQRRHRPENEEQKAEPQLHLIQESLFSLTKMLQEEAQHRGQLQKLIEESAHRQAAIERNVEEVKGNLDVLQAGQAEILKAIQNKNSDEVVPISPPAVVTMEIDEEEEKEEGEVEEESEEEEESDDDTESVGVVIEAPDGEIYTLVKKLAAGGFAEVHLVKDSQQRKFALKLASLDRVSYRMIATEKALYKAMEGREPSPFISARYYPFEATLDGVTFHCEKMDLCKIDIFDALDREYHFDLDLILRMVAQASSALAFINQFGFIHTDIKTDNIMFSRFEVAERDGRKYVTALDTKLIDFNVMFQLQGEEPEIFQGQSFPYRAPEMALAMPCDFKIDVWSLGIVAMQMLQLPNGGFYVANEEGHKVPSLEQALLGEIEALFTRIPRKMIKQSRHPLLCEATSFPRLIAPSKWFCWTLADALNALGDGSSAVNFKFVLKRMLCVDVDERWRPCHIARHLGME